MPGLVRRRNVVPLVHEPGAELRRQRVRDGHEHVVQRARLPDGASDSTANRVSFGKPERVAVCQSVNQPVKLTEHEPEF